MKTIILTICALALASCAGSPQWEQVIANRSAKGDGVDGQCDVYARDLQSKLSFPTQRITWTAQCNEPIPATVRHTVLAYSVGEESWFIDNVSATPIWVGKVTDPIEDRAKQFYAPSWVTISNIHID
jgi:hypothetical protein